MRYFFPRSDPSCSDEYNQGFSWSKVMRTFPAKRLSNGDFRRGYEDYIDSLEPDSSASVVRYSSDYRSETGGF